MSQLLSSVVAAKTINLPPFNTPTRNNPTPFHSVSLPVLRILRCSARRKSGFKKNGPVRASIAIDPREELERCWKLFSLDFPTSSSSSSSSRSAESSSGSSSTMMAPEMAAKKEYGPLRTLTRDKGKSAVVLQPPKRKSKVGSPLKLSNDGSGGDMGKKNNHGGGDGGDDGGDDDDFLGDFDEGDEGGGDEGGLGGLFRSRILLEELFDRKFVDAVLQEWYKTMMDLPAGLRQAYQMGLLSSAQTVKYLSVVGRPTFARSISRSLPQAVSRAFIGRMIADPAFMYKMILEQVATIGCTTWWEVEKRKGRLKKEWDLALINVLTASASNAIVVWSLAPCRSYGNTFKFDLQNTIQKLPNNIFERSYPLREFDLQKRLHSFFYKAAEMCMVGMTAGLLQGCSSNFVASKKDSRLSVTLPSISTNALGYGAFLGLYANMRYQLVNGFERAMFDRFDVLGVAIFFGTTLRLLNIKVGETSRLAWLGVEVNALQSDDLKIAYERPVESKKDAKTESNWFISKNAIVSGLGLLGIRQGSSNSDSTQSTAPTKARRKRVVRKKVPTSSS